MSNLFYFVCTTHSGVQELCILCSGTCQFLSLLTCINWSFQMTWTTLRPAFRSSRHRTKSFLQDRRVWLIYNFRETFLFLLFSWENFSILFIKFIATKSITISFMHFSLRTQIFMEELLINFSPEKRFNNLQNFIEICKSFNVKWNSLIKHVVVFWTLEKRNKSCHEVYWLSWKFWRVELFNSERDFYFSLNCWWCEKFRWQFSLFKS